MDVPLFTNLTKKVAVLLNEVEFDNIPHDLETSLDELIEKAKATSEKIKLKATSTECVLRPVTVQACVSHFDGQTDSSVQNRCRRISVSVKRLNLEKEFGPPPPEKRLVVSTECVVPPVTVKTYVSPCDEQTEPSVQNRCRRISVSVQRLNLKKEFAPPEKRCVISLKRMDMQRYLENQSSPVVTRATTTALSTSNSENDVMVSLSQNEIDTENGPIPMRRRYTYKDYEDRFKNGCSIQ